MLGVAKFVCCIFLCFLETPVGHRVHLIALVSRGASDGCARNGEYAIYTNILPYKEWMLVSISVHLWNKLQTQFFATKNVRKSEKKLFFVKTY
jgi:secreted trypsin-like serine protease